MVTIFENIAFNFITNWLKHLIIFKTKYFQKTLFYFFLNYCDHYAAALKFLHATVH